MIIGTNMSTNKVSGNTTGYNNRIYQSQQISSNPIHRFRQNSNRFENVINRSAAFTFKNGSFKTGNKTLPITQIYTIEEKNESKSKSPGKMFNSSLQMRPRKPTNLQDDDHLKIDQFILVNKSDSRGFKHEIDMISENIHRSRTPKKNRSKRVIQKSIPRVRGEVKSRSPMASGLPVVNKNPKMAKRSVKINKKVVRSKIIKSNKEISLKKPARPNFKTQETKIIVEHRKKCNYN